MITNVQRINNAIDRMVSDLLGQLMPDNSLRFRAQRGISKIIKDKINVEMVVPFLEDESGNLDIDNLSSEIMELVATLPPQKMNFGPVEVAFSGQDLKISWPKNTISTLLVGDVGSVRLTSQDIAQLIEYIKNE